MMDRRLTPVQAAEHLGISPEAIYVLNSRKGKGFPQPVYTGRTPTWTPAELDAWRAAHPSKRPARKREDPRQGTIRESHELRVHLALTTMRRQPVLTSELQSLTEHTMRETARQLDAEIEEFHGQADLIHVTVSYPACVSVANLAKQLRGAADRAIRRSPDIKGHLWSKTYYAASVGAHSSAKFDQYVEHLEQPVNN
ncbi:IS200/IS605 family transposase [Streptomyces mirabilis]|uniref:IS200/IS605 family transposase n=1 Tax=Streptomyces mirabilis TaxID=68239 RepID=UPI00332567E9